MLIPQELQLSHFLFNKSLNCAVLFLFFSTFAQINIEEDVS